MEYGFTAPHGDERHHKLLNHVWLGLSLYFLFPLLSPTFPHFPLLSPYLPPPSPYLPLPSPYLPLLSPSFFLILAHMPTSADLNRGPPNLWGGAASRARVLGAALLPAQSGQAQAPRPLPRELDLSSDSATAGRVRRTGNGPKGTRSNEGHFWWTSFRGDLCPPTIWEGHGPLKREKVSKPGAARSNSM